jgi:hypothetical protein
MSITPNIVMIFRGETPLSRSVRNSWGYSYTNQNIQPIVLRVLMATRRARKKCLKKMCAWFSINWFLPWYSCYGRSDWALTDRRLILHKILRNSSGRCARWRGLINKKPWLQAAHFAHQALGEAPEYLRSMIQPKRKGRHSLRSESAVLLEVPRVRHSTIGG